MADAVAKMEEACIIMAHSVSELYSVPLESKKRDMMVRALYAEDAVWSDPLTECTGMESIVANFQSIALAAGAGKLDVEHASFKRDTPSGHGTLRFCGTANYRLRMTPFKLSIRQWSTLVFDNASGKIKSHKDEWSVESLVSNIPLIGRLYTSALRPSVGYLVDGVLGRYMRAAASRAEKKQALLAASATAALQDEGDTTASNGSTHDSSDDEPDMDLAPTGSLSGSEGSAPKTMTQVQEALKTEIRKYIELKQRTSPVGSLGSSSPPVGMGSYGSPNKITAPSPILRRDNPKVSSPPKGVGYQSPMRSLDLGSQAEDDASGRAVPVPVLGARRLSRV